MTCSWSPLTGGQFPHEDRVFQKPSHIAKSVGCQFQGKNQTKTDRLRYNSNLRSKMASCVFCPCLSNMIKHSFETSKPPSFQLKLKLNVLIVQVSKFI